MSPSINQCPVRWQAINHGQNLALKTDQASITYQQLDNQLVELQKQLSQQIDELNDQYIRLVCIASNQVTLVLLQLLCIRLGWLFCPLNPRFTHIEIEQRLDILNSQFCWAADTKHQQYNTLDLDLTTLSTSPKNDTSPLLIAPLQPCNIIFTSGSSGFPKAIIHHYKNHFYSALGSQSLIPLMPTDHNLLTLPLFHIGGYATVVRSVIAGACIHLSEQSLSFELLQQRKITHLSLVSTQLIRLLEVPLFTHQHCPIKHILLGGSAFSESLLSTLSQRSFHYHVSYGCTEMSSQVATSVNSTALTVLPYRDLKIEKSVIYLRGETRFMGYFQNKKIMLIDEKKWINIGDTGQFINSHLHIIGRKDRQFIRGGENIIPEEIERVCLQYTDVEKVYILPVKDTEYGNKIAIFIAFTNFDKNNFQQQCEQLKQRLSNQLTRYKQPTHYLIWPNTENKLSLKVPRQQFIDSLKQKGLF